MNFETGFLNLRIRALLTFSIPFLILTLFGSAVGVNSYDLFRMIAETGIVSLVSLVILNLIPSVQIKQWLYKLFYILIALQVFLNLSYFKLYRDRINTTTIYILLETKLTEMSELLSAYFTWYNIFLISML